MLRNLHLYKESEVADSTSPVSSSIDALMQEFYIITHNLANVSTVGFKRRCNAFSRSLESQAQDTQTYSPGVIDVETVYGKGFFVIETPDGPLYTRNGMFQTNHNGQIVDSNGNMVAGETGAITIPAGVGPSQLTVSGDGSISADGIAIGKFRLVTFEENEDQLVSVGSNCFQMPNPDVQPVAAQNVVVKQGYQEASNVKIVEELVDMIMVSRLYEANMKLISAQKEASSSILGVAMG
jgi:flagellar basal body rod protein FlgG